MHKAEHADLFDLFGKKHDRFGFPQGIRRVTAGRGGEAILICGDTKKALLDCGMAYCGPRMVDNLKRELRDETLDYIILSHSHYDHVGALPYVKSAYPDAIVLGAEHAAKILVRTGARRLIKALGENARDVYDPDSEAEIPTDHLYVDQVIHDGERIDLGNRELLVLETKGHTDCSLTFVLEPDRVMFTSESTGILERLDYVHTPILKSYKDALDALDKCRNYRARHIVLPHFGLLPETFNGKYWNLYEMELQNKRRYLAELTEKGMTKQKIFEAYLKKYWNPMKAQEQPYKAFVINSGHIVHTLLQSLTSDYDRNGSFI